MIIRLTFGDNDVILELSDFCEGLRDRMFAFEEPWPERSESSSVEEYRNALISYLDARNKSDETRRKLMDSEKKFDKRSKAYKQICDEVIRLWNKFAPSVDMENWGTPDVSIQYSLDEKWENAEVVYYFTTHDKWIAQ